MINGALIILSRVMVYLTLAVSINVQWWHKLLKKSELTFHVTLEGRPANLFCRPCMTQLFDSALVLTIVCTYKQCWE